MQTKPAWRRMTAEDLDAVEAIAAAVHPEFFEDRAIFAERQRLYPEGTHLLEIAGAPSGYLLSHPWQHGTLPALNSLLDAIPDDADGYYLHDLALLPNARGTGAASVIVDQIVDHAIRQGFAAASLVAVNSSVPFWQKQGFVVTAVPGLTDTLLSYEDTARFMTRRLA